MVRGNESHCKANYTEEEYAISLTPPEDSDDLNEDSVSEDDLTAFKSGQTKPTPSPVGFGPWDSLDRAVVIACFTSPCTSRIPTRSWP